MSTLYDIINILPLSLLAVILFGGYAGMPEGSVIGFIICLVLSLWIIILRNLTRKNRLRGIGIVAVFFIGLLLAAGEENRQHFLEEYFWVIYIAGIAVCAVIAGIIADKNIWVRRAVAAALLVYCVTGTILGWEISKEAFALICVVLIVRAAEEIQRKWKKSGCPDIREHITRISPLFLAVCLLVYIIPASDEPYDWQLAKDIWNNTVSCIVKLYGYITHGSDDYGETGFSDSGGFLAGLNGNDEEVLFITAGNTTLKDFRLVGCVSSDFTGREWVFDTGSESSTRMTDTIETSCAVRMYAGTEQSDFMQKTDMYCETYFYNTRYIFSPAKIRLEATKEKNAEVTGLNGISEKGGSIVTEQRLNYKDNYMVSCYALNYGNPELPELLESAEPIDKAGWERTVQAESASDGCSYEDYLKYRSDIYTNCCRSFDVSGEVGKIIDEIRSGSTGRYETLKNLEKYLRSIRYSTDCGALPDYVTDAGSFLDYFLLNSRKGYCMHFATAFVLMANEMGIPCRYVQGYNVRRDINSNIVVRQSSAHAWPEAYFENVGWVAFEPTPGYSVPVGWGARPDNNDADDNDEDETGEESEESDETEEAVPEQAGIDPLIFIIPSAAALGFILLFYIISRSASRNRYRRMPCGDKFRYLTQQNIRFLGLLGFRMESSETLSEFSDRIVKSDREDIKNDLGFIPVYERVLYSDRVITEEDVGAAEKIYSDLRELVRKSRLRYRLMLLIK